MGVTVDGKFNIYMKQGDKISLVVNTIGNIKAEVNDAAIFMIKEKITDADVDAVLVEYITVGVDNEIPILITSDRTDLLEVKNYYWSVKHIKGDTRYTVVPDAGNTSFPKLKVRGVLINE